MKFSARAAKKGVIVFDLRPLSKAVEYPIIKVGLREGLSAK